MKDRFNRKQVQKQQQETKFSKTKADLTMVKNQLDCLTNRYQQTYIEFTTKELVDLKKGPKIYNERDQLIQDVLLQFFQKNLNKKRSTHLVNEQALDGFVFCPVKMQDKKQSYSEKCWILMDHVWNEKFRDGQIGNRIVYFKNEKQTGDRVKYHMISLHPEKLECPEGLDFKQAGNKKRMEVSVKVRSKTSETAGESSDDNQRKYDLDAADDSLHDLEFNDQWSAKKYAFEFTSEESLKFCNENLKQIVQLYKYKMDSAKMNL